MKMNVNWPLDLTSLGLSFLTCTRGCLRPTPWGLGRMKVDNYIKARVREVESV